MMNHTLLWGALTVGVFAFILGRMSATDEAALNSSDALAAQALRQPSPRMAQSRGLSRVPRTIQRPTIQSSEQALEHIVEIFGNPDLLQCNIAWCEFVSTLSLDEFPSVMAALLERGLFNSRQDTYELLFSEWARLDPEHAIRHLWKGHVPSPIVSPLLHAWGRHDPHAALAWFESLGDEYTYKINHLPDLIEGVAHNDLQLATDYYTKIDDRIGRELIFDSMLPAIGLHGTDYVRNWIGQLPAGDCRQGAIKEAAMRLAADDAAGFADWLEEFPGEGADVALPFLMYSWTMQDLNGAADYVARIADKKTKSRALISMLHKMEHDHSLGEIQSVMDRFSGKVDDSVYETLISDSVSDHPELGIRYVSLVQDEGTRSTLYQSTLRKWLDTDYHAANSWIAHANLPQEVIDDIHDFLEHREETKSPSSP